MTLEELIDLHEQLNLILFEQAKSVTVPQGTWQVGKDIPAGTYIIKCADINHEDIYFRRCCLKWGSEKPVKNGSFDSKSELGWVDIFNPNSSHYKEGQLTEFILTLEDGMFVYIDEQNNKAVFYQYTGPSFTFDW